MVKGLWVTCRFPGSLKDVEKHKNALGQFASHVQTQGKQSEWSFSAEESICPSPMSREAQAWPRPPGAQKPLTSLRTRLCGGGREHTVKWKSAEQSELTIPSWKRAHYGRFLCCQGCEGLQWVDGAWEGLHPEPLPPPQVESGSQGAQGAKKQASVGMLVMRRVRKGTGVQRPGTRVASASWEMHLRGEGICPQTRHERTRNLRVLTDAVGDRPAGAGGMRKASRQQGQLVGMRCVLNVHFPSTYRQQNKACSKAPWRLYTGVSQAPKAPDSVSSAKISTLEETP